MLSDAPAALGGGSRQVFPCGPSPLPAGSGRTPWQIILMTEESMRNRNMTKKQGERSERGSARVAVRGLQTGCADLPAPCSRRLIQRLKVLIGNRYMRRERFMKKQEATAQRSKKLVPMAVFFCPLILPALTFMARGELLRSRSLKRPPLANFARSGYGVISKKNLPGSGRLATG